MWNKQVRAIQVSIIAVPLIRWGVERLVQTMHPQLELIAGATELAEAWPLLERNTPDVFVLMGDGVQIKEMTEFCAKSTAKVVVLSSSGDSAWHDTLVIAGAKGIVRIEEQPAALLKAIEKVHDGELWIDRGATGRIFMEIARRKAAERNNPESSKIATLTMRERQTIVAVVQDSSAPGKVIASRLCISEHTLRNHLTSIYTKLGLSNRVDLYAYATRNNLNAALAGASTASA